MATGSRGQVGWDSIDHLLAFPLSHFPTHSTDRQDEMTTQTYKVKGMNCGGCERSVELSVSQVTGVAGCKADAPSGSLKVEFSADPVPADLVKQAVARAGYTFVS